MVEISEFTKVVRGEVRSGVIRRRRWSAEMKGRIVGEAVAPGVVIAEVARRHDLMPQQLSNWIRAVKKGEIGRSAESALGFVPVIATGTVDGSSMVGAAIEIAIGSAVVRVPFSIDGQRLEVVLRAVRAALT